jgi:4-amino-4-deoxy-L-arabinose transferase-like glycosyltransferase
VAACVVLAVWAKRWFGAAGAIIATVLLTTTPPMLAHAGLATTDLASAATVFLALGSLFAVIARPSLKTATAAGCCVALALLSKFSSIPFLAVCIPVMLFFRWLLGPAIPWRSGAEWRRVSQLAVVAVAVAC